MDQEAAVEVILSETMRNPEFDRLAGGDPDNLRAGNTYEIVQDLLVNFLSSGITTTAMCWCAKPPQKSQHSTKAFAWQCFLWN